LNPNPISFSKIENELKNMHEKEYGNLESIKAKTKTKIECIHISNDKFLKKF